MKVQPMRIAVENAETSPTESLNADLLMSSKTSMRAVSATCASHPQAPSSNSGAANNTQFRVVNMGTKTQSEKFAPNVVKTSIYSVYSFLPKNLFKQFTRFSNVYFLFITALQLIPEVTSTPGFPTMVVPLVFIIVVSAVRDFIEDLDRHRSDDFQNSAPIAKLDLESRQSSSSDTNVSFEAGICADLHVGELVRVRQNDEIPADIVLLAASRGHGQCYVMTANLDGESTLKPRYVPPELCVAPFGLECFSADGELTGVGIERIQQLKVECEPPNRRIDRFDGAIKFPMPATANAFEVSSDLDITHVLLKGTQLKDTEWVIGVVVYTGDDTRVRQNSSDTPIKQSWLYHFINKITLWVVLAQIVILTVAVVVEKDLVTSNRVRLNPYIDEDVKNVDTLDLVYLFLAYMLLFSNFVPISLQVTIDVTRYFQAMVIQRDPEMHITSSSLGSPSSPTTGNLDAQSKPSKQTSVRVQSSELNEELGLVEYVFTDKTGTLTCNRMAFRSCHLDGKTYDFDDERGALTIVTEDVSFTTRSSSSNSHDPEPKSPGVPSDDSLQDVSTLPPVTVRSPTGGSKLSPQMTKFLLNLAANNSISPSAPSTMPDRKSTKSLLSASPRMSILTASKKTDGGTVDNFSGPSPDEKALVIAAARLGVKLTRRDNSRVTLSMNGIGLELQILQLFQFTSDRKKSSIVCRHPNGKIVLYCKGADSVILRALSDKNQSATLHRAKEQMQWYSSNGLRVLCIAERELSEGEYSAWSHRFVELRAELKKKSKSRGGGSSMEVESEQADALASLVSELECELTLVGISAIEDKIQDGAPETLEKFREAGIKVWMLTGDRPDTATNVAYAVKLISSDMKLIKLTDTQWLESKETALQFLLKEIKQIQGESRTLTSSFLLRKPLAERASTGDGLRFAVILSDSAVEAIRRFGLEHEFLELCSLCESVLCARISPKQKEFIVEMVRSRYPHKVTMAVGDGANDVPMIQRAHIGVGIAGEEGNQASDASDYSIPAFRFLQKLVLVHGRSMNRRISVLTLYIFYKNVLLVLPQFVYGIYCLFSGQSSYYDPLLQLFNICFTSLPVLYFSVFDQDISAATTLLYPRLYQDGPLHSFLNRKMFVFWMVEATVASILIILVPAKLIPLVPWSGSGKDNDLWSLGLTQNFVVVFLANARLLLEVSMNHRTMLTLASISVLFWWVVVYVMSSSVSFGREFYGILHVGSLTQLALCCVFCTGLSLLVPFLPRVVDILVAPQPRTICRELDYLTNAKDLEYMAKRKSTAFTGDGDSRAVVVPT